MFVLYGTRKKVKPVVSLGHGRCENCNHTVELTLAKEKHAFTVFFIPVFVRTGSRFILCPCCGEAKKLTKKEFKELKSA